MPVRDDADRGRHQRVSGMQQGRDMVVAIGTDVPGIEGDAVVDVDDGLAIARDPVTFLDFGRNAPDFEPVALAHSERAADVGEGFVKEGLDVVGLQTCRLCPLHLLTHLVDL